MSNPISDKKIPRRSLLFLVPFIGLLYDAICHVYSFLFYYLNDPSFAIFIVIPLIGALAVLRGGRIGYIVAAIISLQFFLVEGPFGGLADSAWSSVTVTDYFLIYITIVPALFLAFVFSLIGLKQLFLPRWLILRKPSARMIPTASLMVFVGIGFILGGTTIGMFAAQTEIGLAHQAVAAPSGYTVTIVAGAYNSHNSQFFSPSSLTVKVGTTVTWVNDDTVTHTVTSTDGAFDSGPMLPNTSFSYTFTQSGTYTYTCTYHPWMTGTIVVILN